MVAMSLGELVAWPAQYGYKKLCTSQGWQVTMQVSKGREKRPGRQTVPLFFLILCITAGRLDRDKTSPWHAPVLYLLQNSTREMTRLYRTDKTAPACVLLRSCRKLEVSHSCRQREIPSLFPWVTKGVLGPIWLLAWTLVMLWPFHSWLVEVPRAMNKWRSGINLYQHSTYETRNTMNWH